MVFTETSSNLATKTDVKNYYVQWLYIQNPLLQEYQFELSTEHCRKGKSNFFLCYCLIFLLQDNNTDEIFVSIRNS